MNKFNLTASGGFKIGAPLAAKAATASHAEKLHAHGVIHFGFV